LFREHDVTSTIHTPEEHKDTNRVKRKNSETLANSLDHVSFTDRTQRSWSESKPEDLHLESPEMHKEMHLTYSMFFVFFLM